MLSVQLRTVNLAAPPTVGSSTASEGSSTAQFNDLKGMLSDFNMITYGLLREDFSGSRKYFKILFEELNLYDESLENLIDEF